MEHKHGTGAKYLAGCESCKILNRAYQRTIYPKRSRLYQEWRTEYLKTHPCVKCGATEALHFDHIDPNTKVRALSNMLNYSLDSILEELEKCQVLCRFCHGQKSRQEQLVAVS